MRWPIVLLLVASACFPESARHRRYAKIGEGVLVAGGIALNYLASSSGCMQRPPGSVVDDCDQSIAQLDNLGLVMIFSGLVGFAATMISANQDPDDDRGEAPTQDRGVVAAPAAFCPAMWAGDLPQAEAALATYVKSVGAHGVSAAGDALHAWLSRQACVSVEDEPEDVMLSIRIRVSVREQTYRIDFSASPFIVLIPEDLEQ